MSGAGLNLLASVGSTEAKNGLCFCLFFDNHMKQMKVGIPSFLPKCATVTLRASWSRTWKQHCLGKEIHTFTF